MGLNDGGAYQDHTYAWRHAPLKSYIEFAGIHSDFFFASEGTASPNSPSALMNGRLRHAGFRAAGAAALIPSSAQKRSGSSSRSFKAIFKRGMPRNARFDPDAERTAPYHICIAKKPDLNPVFYCKIQLCDCSKSFRESEARRASRFTECGVPVGKHLLGSELSFIQMLKLPVSVPLIT